MKDSALQDALEAERRLHVGFVGFRQQRSLLVDALGELATKLRDVRFACLQYFVNLRDIQQREQQVLDRHELMTPLACPLEGLVKTEF